MGLLLAGEVLRRLTWVLAMSSFYLRCNPCGAGQLVFYWGLLNSAAHLWRRPMSLPQPGESSLPVRNILVLLFQSCVDYGLWLLCMADMYVVAFYSVYLTSMRFACGFALCRHKPFGVTAIFWCGLHLIGIFKMSHYFYIWFHLMPHCTVVGYVYLM